MNILPKFVKNFTALRNNWSILVIVLHITDGSKESVFYTFNDVNDPFPRSSHYLVDKQGQVYQMVKEEDTAWAQGRVKNPVSKIVLSHPKINPNLYSLSIETEGVGYLEPNTIQYQALASLVKDITTRYSIPLDKDHIVRHNEIYSLKACPGRLDRDKVIALAIGTHESLASRPAEPTQPFILHPSNILKNFKSWFS